MRPAQPQNMTGFNQPSPMKMQTGQQQGMMPPPLQQMTNGFSTQAQQNGTTQMPQSNQQIGGVSIFQGYK